MLFHVKAQKIGGEIFEENREAPDKFALFDGLKKEGATMLYAHEVKKTPGGAMLQGLLARFNFGTVPLHQKIIFARNLAAMNEAGLPISRALAVLERQMSSPGMKKVVASLNEAIKKGQPLSDGLAKFPGIFPPIFISMTKAGEEGGNLSGALKNVAGQLERIYYIKRKVRGALMYPAVIVCLIVVVGILMFTIVVPKLTAAFEDVKMELPWSTQMIIFLSNFMKDHYIISLLIAFGVGSLIWFLAQTPKGRRFFDFVFIKFPLIGPMVVEVNAARAARTLSSMLVSGVDVIEAISITSDVVQNSYFKEVLDKAKETIQKGSPLSTTFAEGTVYPPFFTEMVAAGEETGNMSAMLGDVATFYENEVDQKTKDFSTIIEPLIMVFIGGAVGFFAYAMLTPMYSMMSAIQ
ncbi:MAG: type II secretion system F family protein [Candidatus Taylorbacteria bacterium]|nr:type II secretion system F family protein [Candidatus Taylorbacteria bacterium]